MRNKIYIAGPMTGYPNYNFEKFFEVEKLLRDLSYKPVNPARITNANGGQDLFVNDPKVARKVIRIQKSTIRDECDSMVLLDGWNKSIGAKEELKLALKLNLKIYMVSEFYDRYAKARKQHAKRNASKKRNHKD